MNTDNNSTSDNNNMFNVLRDNVTDNEIVNNNNDNMRRYTLNNPPLSARNRIKIPPVVIFNLKVNQVQQILSKISNIETDKVQIKITQFGHYVYASNLNDFKKIRKYCEDNNKTIQYHSHLSDDEKRVKYCIYGLYVMDTKLLMNELNRVGVYPHNAEILNIKKKRYDEQCIWVLTFLKGNNVRIEDLRKITGIFNVRVRFEHFNRLKKFTDEPEPSMCTRCQNFNHGHEKCGHPPRCVRCGEDHESSKCPHLPLPSVDNLGNEIPNQILRIPENKVKCANCHGPHTASFRGCPKRIEIKQMMSALKHKNQMRQSRQIVPNIYDTRVFQPLPPPTQNFWQNKQHHTQQNASYQHINNNNTNDMFSAQECNAIMNEFISKMSQCRSKIDQIRIIGEVTFKFLFNNDSK